MSHKDKRWQPISDMAENAERSQATRLGDVQRRLAEAEKRLEDLVRYRIEYEQSFHARARDGAEVQRLREHQVFIAKLGEAGRAQQQVVIQLRGECELAREQWREAATHKKVVGKVIENVRAEQRREDDRRLQHEIDERAMRPRSPL